MNELRKAGCELTPKLRWAALGLAFAMPVVAIALVVRAAYHEYSDGITFRAGLRSFAWIGTIISNGPLLAGCGLIPVVIGILVRRSPRARNAALIAGGISTLALLSLIIVLPRAFLAGRSRAYSDADHARIYAGSQAVWSRMRVAMSQPVHVDRTQPAYAELPPGLRELRPLFVLVGRRGVAIQMDGGGIMAHEGFFVPLGENVGDPDELARRHPVRVLSREPAVLRYQIYDVRGLPIE